MDSLWPDFQEVPVRITPGTILKEQAKALGDMFQNRIRGHVIVRQTGDKFLCAFNLHCSPLSYSYELFKVEFGLINIYPASVILKGDIAEEILESGGSGILEVTNEKDFRQALTRIFSANKTRHVIQGLRQHLE